MRIFVSTMMTEDGDLPALVDKLGSYIDGFHVDSMDGEFVPYKKAMCPAVDRLRKCTALPIWLHLMVNHPRAWLESVEGREGDTISVHYESYSTQDALKEDLIYIRRKGMLASLALNPKTPVQVVQAHIACADQIVLMGVEPGRSGQVMLKDTKNKIKELYTIRAKAQSKFRIGLDGGITPESLASLHPYMPDDSAVGTSIIHAKYPLKIIELLHKVACEK